MNPLLCTHHLALGYSQDHPLAQGVNLQFQAGQLVCLAGPNGSGKSTLLRTLAGLLPPIQGHVTLLGKAFEEWSDREKARHLAIVFARFPSSSYLRGREYVALGRSPYTNWLDHLKPQDQAAIEEAIALVDAKHLVNQLIDDLSDGERQRLAIARALAQQTQVLLLDEPTAYLDLPHRVQLYKVLRQWARDRGLCVIMSTHELDLALRFADRMVLLDGKGSVSVGVPEALAFDGSIGHAFQAEGVRFDMESGGFTVEQQGFATIQVTGDCLGAQWTRRALHRLGYQFVLEGYPAITVDFQQQHCQWKVALNPSDEFLVYNLEAALALLPRPQP